MTCTCVTVKKTSRFPATCMSDSIYRNASPLSVVLSNRYGVAFLWRLSLICPLGTEAKSVDLDFVVVIKDALRDLFRLRSFVVDLDACKSTFMARDGD